jgi:two-component system chemotaxis sensor kinase CheA
MLTPQLISQIESLHQATGAARIGDLGTLAGVLRGFQELNELAARAAQPDLTTVCNSAGELVKSILMDDVPDSYGALDALRLTAQVLFESAKSGTLPPLQAYPESLRPKTGGGTVSYKDDDILADFLSRQSGVLQEMEVHILALEKSRAPDSLAALLHILHTMKGDSGFLGLSGVEQLCHSAENYLQGAQFPYDIEVLLTIKDWFATAFAAISTGQDQNPSSAVLITRLEGLGRDRLEIPPAPREPKPESGLPPLSAAFGEALEVPVESTAEETTSAGMLLHNADPGLLAEFVQESREHLDTANHQLLALETDPGDMEALNSVFRAFHTMKGISGFLGLADISHLAHDTENLLDRVRKSELDLTPRIMDLSFSAMDMLGRLIEAVRVSLEAGAPLHTHPELPELLVLIKAAASGAAPANERPKLGELLVASGAISPSELDHAIVTQKTESKGQKLGTILVQQNKVHAARIVEALQQQQSEGDSRVGIHVKDTIRVDYERLENMINTIGEMVLAEAMISQDEAVLVTTSESLQKKVYNLRQVTRKLQELGTSIRMVPIAGTFQKMARLVRDLSKKSGKNIRFQSKGDETELDRAFVDKLADPLVHMIRNAVDHGIESPEERMAAGKTPDANIELRAFHEGGNIHVEILDDGRGLNRDAIVAKAVEKGLISADERLTDNEIFNLIFVPGFSTAKQVTEVSGRGVGMDVVKRNIEELRGYVQILSEMGKGTRFKIILPLTLALIDGMVVRVGNERYVIPVLSVVESLRPPPGIVNSIIGKGEMVTIRNHQIPLFRVDRIFRLKGAEQDPTKALVVVVEHEGKHAGLLVDDLIGMQQTVIKNLGAGLQQSTGFSGGAIMADGRIGLILDVSGVLKLARNETMSRRV